MPESASQDRLVGRTGVHRSCLRGWHYREREFPSRRASLSSVAVVRRQRSCVQPRLVDYLAELLPDARTTVVAGHNHLLPLTAPALLADLCRNPAVTG